MRTGGDDNVHSKVANCYFEQFPNEISLKINLGKNLTSLLVHLVKKTASGPRQEIQLN